jgi:transcriptional regulator with XRE-family HTH domain
MTAIGATTAKPPAHAGAVGSAADAVRRVAKALLAAHDVAPAELALRLGVGKTAIYNRLSGEKPFTLDETAAMSEFFGVPVGAFFAGPAALFGSIPESAAGGRAGAGGSIPEAPTRAAGGLGYVANPQADPLKTFLTKYYTRDTRGGGRPARLYVIRGGLAAGASGEHRDRQGAAA